MPASLFLEFLKGGPFDGLPALGLRFEEEDSELDLGATLSILTDMKPPPMQLRIVHAAGGEDIEPLSHFLKMAKSYGMGISVEIFGGVFPWMLSPMIDWRCLHTTDECVVSPVEEIVFHTTDVPRFSPFPFHALKSPLLWWAPLMKKDIDFFALPQNMRLWWPTKRTPEKKLFPMEEP